MACGPVRIHLGPEQRWSKNANKNENKRQFKEEKEDSVQKETRAAGAPVCTVTQLFMLSFGHIQAFSRFEQMCFWQY